MNVSFYASARLQHKVQIVLDRNDSAVRQGRVEDLQQRPHIGRDMDWMPGQE